MAWRVAAAASIRAPIAGERAELAETPEEAEAGERAELAETPEEAEAGERAERES